MTDSRIFAIDTTELNNHVCKIMDQNFGDRHRILYRLSDLENSADPNDLVIAFVHLQKTKPVTWPVLYDDDGNKNILYVYIVQKTEKVSLSQYCKSSITCPKNYIMLQNIVSRLQLIKSLENVEDMVDTYIALHDDYPFTEESSITIQSLITDLNTFIDIKTTYDGIKTIKSANKIKQLLANASPFEKLARVKGLVDKMIVSDNFDFTGYWLYNDPEASPIVQAYIDLYNKLVEKANFKILK